MNRNPHLEAQLIKYVIEHQNENIDSVDICHAFNSTNSVEEVMYSLDNLQMTGKIIRQNIGVRYHYITPDKVNVNPYL